MAAIAPPPDVDHLDLLEEYLERGDVLEGHSPLVDGGWANKCRVTLRGGVLAIQKPVTGSNAPATMSEEIGVNREVAAWRISRALGWSHLVAATVSTEMWCPVLGDTARACLQVAWPAPTVPLVPLADIADMEIWQAAIFDWLIVQTDRGSNNWLGVLAIPDHGQPAQHRLRLFDHGHAFVAGGAVNSTFYTAKAGQDIPAELIEDLRAAEPIIAAGDLDGLLGPGTSQALVTKLKQLVNDGRLT
jgi:hypothetical protein